jgi:hypothetical protein
LPATAGAGLAREVESMSSLKPRSAALALLLSVSSLAVVGCENEESVTVDGILSADGYALFAVDNDRQQRNDVSVTIREADPGATYVLLYSAGAPKNSGWFQFDPSTKTRCGGDTGPHCETPGFGYMVDVVTVPEGATEITLRDDRCGCNGDSPSESWTGHWAVMRIEHTNRTNKVAFDVHVVKVKDFTTEPQVQQLQ